MTKQFIADVIQESGELTGVAAKRIAEAVIRAIEAEILTAGRLTLPGFGTFILKEIAVRPRLNPQTGESVKGKAGATVRFKAAPGLREAAFAATKKAKRKPKQGGQRSAKTG